MILRPIPYFDHNPAFALLSVNHLNSVSYGVGSESFALANLFAFDLVALDLAQALDLKAQGLRLD